MNNRLVFVFLVSLFLVTCGVIVAQDKLNSNNNTVLRLSPNEFPKLPKGVKADLIKRQCTIPQTFNFNGRPHNVINGNFFRKGQNDWAVLCSSGLISTILIYPGGSAKRVHSVAPIPDDNYLEHIGDKTVYSRGIGVVDREYIIRHYEGYGGPKPPPINHNGINNMREDTASSVFYYYKGEWLRLTGAD